jgi:TonB family protein
MRYVLIGLLSVASAAEAESWQQIAEFETKGSVMFLDTAGLTREGDHRKARLKLVYNTEQPIPDGYGGKQPDVSTYRSDMNDYDVNCAERTVALSRSILHSPEGQVVGRSDIPKRAQTFRKVQPGTAPEKILKTVCHWGEAREETAGAPSQESSAAARIDQPPAGSARPQEQGAPVVKACVGPDGKLLRDPIVTTTSGSSEVDAAAIKVAKATRFSASKDKGDPLAESCIQFKVKFKLAN